MKNGTLYAGRLKRAFAKQRHAVPKPDIPETEDPLRCMAISILAEGCSRREATRATERIFQTMVDWNEVRVSDGSELNKATGNVIPAGPEQCTRLIAALQSVYRSENCLSLDRLRRVGRREARHFLEQLDGVSEYVVASVLLWSLGGHAIPVDDRLLAALIAADLAHPTANRAEVQAFLERHISASDAKLFCCVMHSFSPNKARTAQKRASPKTTSRKKAKTR